LSHKVKTPLGLAMCDSCDELCHVSFRLVGRDKEEPNTICSHYVCLACFLRSASSVQIREGLESVATQLEILASNIGALFLEKPL
jgi:hypothetical protein